MTTLQGIHQTWKRLSQSSRLRLWHKIWPSNENYGTNCDTLDTLIKEISEIAEQVGLDNVDPVGITEDLESHCQPLSTEELYDLAQQLTEEQKESEDEEDHGNKEMHTKGFMLQHNHSDNNQPIQTHKPTNNIQNCKHHTTLTAIHPTPTQDRT